EPKANTLSTPPHSDCCEMLPCLAALRGHGHGHTIDRLQNARDDLVRIGLGVRTAILEVALVAVLDEVHRQPDRSAAIRKTIAELVDRLRLMQSSQAKVVVRTVDRDVLRNVLFEGRH